MTSMDSFIRRAAGRGSGDHPRSTITDGDDAFTRRAKELGVAPDLVDAARAVVPNAGDLSGAALHSALERAISDRPSLRVAESRVPQGGLAGGASAAACRARWMRTR